jgi:adenylate cyclase
MAVASKPMICRGCWEQLRVPVPIRGPLAAPFRLFGIKRSNMNPDLCTICELMFATVMRRRNIEVDLTIMFADLRGYTALAQEIDQDRMRDILDFFYDECAAAIWSQDGLLNKTLGDGVMAVFNFPLTRTDHARRAVEAARAIQRRCSERRTAATGGRDLDPRGLAVGIGIHSGLTAFGEFGRAHRDVTAVGSVVNLAARFQSAAAAGEIVVSREVLDRIGGERKGERDFVLKGFAEPVTAFLM